MQPLRLRWACAFLLVLTPVRSAWAQEPAPVDVRVKPGGQEWSIGDHGGTAECGTCLVHLAPQRYHVVMGETSEEVLIDVSSEVAYRPGLPAVRAVGWVMIGAGLVGGGIATYGAIRAFKVCASANTPNPDCPNGSTPSSTKVALASVAGGSFGAGVVGGFFVYLAGESIRVRDLPRAASGFTVDVSSRGAALGWSSAF